MSEQKEATADSRQQQQMALCKEKKSLIINV